MTALSPRQASGKRVLAAPHPRACGGAAPVGAGTRAGDHRGRSWFVGALVVSGSVLLGAVPLEAMQLIVHPARQRLEPDPAAAPAPMLW